MTQVVKETRKKQVHVPVTDRELTQINRNAGAVGLGKAAYLRELGLHHAPPAQIDQDRVEALQKINADLGRMGGLLKWWLSDDEFIKGGRVPVARLHEVLDDIRVTQKLMRAAIAALAK